jgi:hypothetical protein
MVCNLPNAFELILWQFEAIEEILGLFHHDGEIVNIDAGVFVMGTAVLHPDIRIGFTRRESHICEGVSKLFVETSAAGA